MLKVSDLHVGIGGTPILNGVSLTCSQGERVGVVGESGSGKTMMALSIIGLLPDGAETRGEVSLNGEDLLQKSDKDMNQVRGRRVSMIFQDSLSSLDPLMKVGRQIALPLRRRNLSRSDTEAEATSLLEEVQLDRPAERLKSYPHQLSGGQRQRVSLAMALAGEPELLIADEPTTALDVTVKAEVIKLIRRVIDRTETTLILITHDLPLVAYACDRIVVMYGGYIVEEGPAKQILNEPRHQYTASLIASMPAMREGLGEGERMKSIPGSVPAAGDFPSGCPFRNRCVAAIDECQEMPDMDMNGDHRYACWNPVEVSR